MVPIKQFDWSLEMVTEFAGSTRVLIGSEEIVGGTKIPEEVLKYQNFKI